MTSFVYDNEQALKLNGHEIAEFDDLLWTTRVLATHDTPDATHDTISTDH